VERAGWSGGVERAEWSGRARAARGAGWVEWSGWWSGGTWAVCACGAAAHMGARERRVERASGASCVEKSGSAGAAGAEVEAARESGAWSGPGGAAGWSGLSGAGAREREIRWGEKELSFSKNMDDVEVGLR
jgi:hypothetical protein